jgi:hypothetical protein
MLFSIKTERSENWNDSSLRVAVINRTGAFFAIGADVNQPYVIYGFPKINPELATTLINFRTLESFSPNLYTLYSLQGNGLIELIERPSLSLQDNIALTIKNFNKHPEYFNDGSMHPLDLFDQFVKYLAHFKENQVISDEYYDQAIVQLQRSLLHHPQREDIKYFQKNLVIAKNCNEEQNVSFNINNSKNRSSVHEGKLFLDDAGSPSMEIQLNPITRLRITSTQGVQILDEYRNTWYELAIEQMDKDVVNDLKKYLIDVVRLLQFNGNNVTLNTTFLHLLYENIIKGPDKWLSHQAVNHRDFTAA